MPNRIIKESIKRSPEIDTLSWFEETVFYRLIVSADDYGCFEGRTNILRNELFPTKDNITAKAIETAISNLVKAGLLCKYTVNGIPYLLFPSWEKHQRVRCKHRKYPAPPENFDLTASCCQMSASCLPESESESNNIPPYSPKGECSPTGEAPPHSKRFIPPDAEEVEAYCRERNNHIDAQRFVDFYASKGWKVGKEPMKDWKAAVRTWERRNDTTARASPRHNRGRDQYSTRSYSAKDLEKMGNEVSLE